MEKNNNTAKEREAFLNQKEERHNKVISSDVEDTSTPKSPSKVQFALITVVVYASYLSCGLCYSIGPVLLDLQELFEADTQSISLSFIGQGAGYLIGSITGGILIDRVASTAYYTISTVGMSIFLAIMSWMPNLILFIIIYAMNTTFLAMVDGGGAVTLLTLWQGSRHQDSIVHGSRLMLSIGAALAPVVVGPFLSKRSSTMAINETSLFVDTFNLSGKATLTASEIFEDETNNISYHKYSFVDETTLAMEYGHTRVQYGLTTVAGIMTVSVALSVVAFIWLGAHVFQKNNKTALKKVNNAQKTLENNDGTHFGFVVLSALFYFGYSATELSIFSFIALFVVKELKWEKLQGSMITTVLFGSQAMSRFLGIFIAQCLQPSSIMYIDLSVAITSAVFLLFSKRLPEVVTWLAVSTFGLGMGSFNSASYCFASKYVQSGGILSASMLASSSISIMAVLPFVGYLYDAIGPMAMVHVCLATGLFTLVVVISIDCLGRRRLEQGVKISETAIVTEIDPKLPDF